MRSLDAVLVWLCAGAVVATASATGCHRDLAGWRTHLEQIGAARSVGLWSATLDVDPAPGDTTRSSISGQIALTLNEQRREEPGLAEPPTYFGTYDLAFPALGFREGEAGGAPTLVGLLRGDSLILRLAPRTERPVEFRGAFRGDSIVGRWHASQLRGIDRMGVFVLRRR